jgi:flagellar motor switch protein FliM
MSEASTASLLRRIARPAAPPPPLTPARALRHALARAAEGSIGLPLSVLGIREEEERLDDHLSSLEDGLLMLTLVDGADAAGFIALDPEARAAAIEAQTLGEVLDRPAEPRAPTAADAALVQPLLATFLREAEEAMAGTPLAGWLRAPKLGDRLTGSRDAALALADGAYRAVRLTLDLGAGSREGMLLLLHRLPPPPCAADPAPDDPGATVAPEALRAQAELEAILHRLELPLAEAEALVPGQIIALPGVTVASVRLQAGGLDLGPARLGQMSGMRAVRIESPLSSQNGAFGPTELSMTEGVGDSLPLAGPGADGPPSLLPGGIWEPPENEEAP